MQNILCIRKEASTLQSLDMDMMYYYSTMVGVVVSGLQKNLSMSVCLVLYLQMSMNVVLLTLCVHCKTNID